MKKKSIILLLGLVFISSSIALSQIGYSSGSVSQTRAHYPTIAENIVVEEFINYHKHILPMPVGKNIEMDLRWGNDEYNQNTKEAILQVGFTTKSHDNSFDAPAINISLVVDCSGSMAGYRLDKVKEALIEFTKHLRDKDVISIVSYGDEAKVVFPAQKNIDKNILIKKISSLEDEGGTNLCAGMELGYKQVLKNYKATTTNKVILLTDGCANVGVVEDKEIISISKKYNSEGLDITTVGIGYGSKNELLRKLSNAGNGSNHFIGNDEDIKKVFVNEAQSLLAGIAKNVKLKIEYAKDFNTPFVFGYEPKINQNTIDFELNNMNCGLTQVVLCKLKMNNNLNNPKLVKVTLSYFDIESQTEKVITKTTELISNQSAEQNLLIDNEVKRNYSIGILAQGLKDKAIADEKGKSKKGCEYINECLKEFHSYYPNPKDKAILRVLEIVERYHYKVAKN